MKHHDELERVYPESHPGKFHGDSKLVNATQDEVDAGDGGLRLVGPDDPRYADPATQQKEEREA